MKKIVLAAAALFSFNLAAKADIIIVYRCGSEICSTIKRTSLKCADFKFEPIVIDCYDVKSGTSGKLGNSTLKNGTLSDENGLVLGKVADENAKDEPNLADYKIQESTTTPDGKIMVGNVFLGQTLKKE